jgi:hypothetical protein
MVYRSGVGLGTRSSVFFEPKSHFFADSNHKSFPAGRDSVHFSSRKDVDFGVGWTCCLFSDSNSEMAAFQQEELFLHFGDLVYYALGAAGTAEKSILLCALDEIVCAYQEPLQSTEVDGARASFISSVFSIF